jgi:hypothetical protein
MHQDWIQRSENTLHQIKKLMENTEQDRLELVRVMRFAMTALGQSLGGWMQWINSPEIMSNFTQKELYEMTKTMTDMVTQFIDYDVKVTNMGMEKGLAKRRASRQQGISFVI